MNKRFLVISLFLLLVFSSFVSASKESLQVDNVAFYSGDDVTLDSSFGGSPVGADGILNGSISFDGSTDYITSSNPVPVSDYFNISLSFNFNADTLGDAVDILVQGRDGSSSQFVIYIGSGKPHLALWQSDLTYIETDVSGESALSIDTWYNLSAVADGSNIYLYVNGVQYGTSPSYDGTTGSSTIMNIGYDITNSGRYFGGLIDEVKIYNSSDLVYYNSMDSLWDYSGNSNHATANGGVGLDSSGYFYSAYSFDGIDDYINTGNQLSGLSAFSINSWFKADSTSGSNAIYECWGATSDKFKTILRVNDGNILFITYTISQAGGNTQTFTDTTGWHMLTATYDGTTMRTYVDGVESGTTYSQTGNIQSSSEPEAIGANIDRSDFYFDGLIDEVYIFNVNLTQSNISELYALTSNIYTLDESAVNNFSVTASNIDSVSLSNFSVEINGVVYNTTNGTIITNILNNDTSLYNLSFSSDEAGGYYNASALNVNVSSDYEFTNLYQSVVSVYAEDIFNDSISYDFVNDSYGQSANTLFFPNPIANKLYAEINALFGNVTYTVNKAGYYNVSDSFTIVNNTQTVTVSGLYNSIVNVTTQYGLNNNSVSNFNVSVNNTYYSNSYSTTTNYLEIPLLSTYNYTFDWSKNNYTSESNYTSNLISGVSSLVFNVWTFNSIRINLYDFETETLLNGTNVNISVISDSLSFENSTNTSFLLIDLLNPESYELRFKAVNYSTTSRFLTVTNDSTTEINVYLSKNSSLGLSAELQEFEIVDTAGTIVPGAVVTMQEQLIGGTTTYITTQQATTNSEGKVAMWVVKSVEKYYRQSVAVNGETKQLSPSGEYWTTPDFFIPGITETRTLIIDLSQSTQTNIEDRIEVATNLKFNTTTNTFSYEWVDSNNAISGARLLITAKALDSNTRVIIYNSSSESLNGLLSYNITPVNNSLFTAKGYIIWNTREELTDELTKTYEITQFVNLATGLILSIIILMVVYLLTVQFGGLISGLVLFGTTFILTQLKLLFVANSVIIAFIGLVIILFIKVKKNE